MSYIFLFFYLPGMIFYALQVLILEHKSIIASGYSCVLHIQAAIEEVTVQVTITLC